MTTETNDGQPAANAGGVEGISAAELPGPLKDFHADTRTRQQVRGKTKVLIRSFEEKTRPMIRKSMRHEGDVGKSAQRGRRSFWHARLASLHTHHGMWVSTVEHLQWKHVLAIIEDIREGGYASETQRSYFSYLAWGLVAFGKPHLEQRMVEYLVKQGVRPAAAPLH
mgnify:FL=1